MTGKWRQFRFRRTTIIAISCVACLAGIGLARAGVRGESFWLWLSATGCAITIRRRTSLAVIWAVLFGLSLGLARGDLFVGKLNDYQPFYGQKITITARAIDDGVYGTNSQISFDAGDIQLTNGQTLAGKIELSGFGPTAVFQGDILEATGQLYPSRGSYQARMSFAQLQVLERQPTLVADLRRKFTAGMQSALPEPLAPFAMGLLIGQRATLPANVKQDLLMVGLTHIIAVSGYNLTIMLQASQRLLAGRSKRLTTFLSLALIGVFLLFAGASASIIRAAMVSLLSISAGYYGRRFRPLNLILLAAAITAWANPFYLWSDSSWYLSFLAFYGVLQIAPLLRARWPRRWPDSLLVNVALESICAELMTLPFILFTFGQMSLIGLPANLLITTLVSLAMLLSLIAGLAGMLAGSIAGWLAWPARLVLTYMLDTAHLLAKVPHIFLQNLSLSAKQMLLLYACVITTAIARGFKLKHKNGTITDRNERTF